MIDTGTLLVMTGVVPSASLADRRVLTVPNVVSFARLLCVPVFLWLVWGAGEPIAAAALLGGLGATDWVDGYIARHFAQGSELGKILDPVADRAVLIAGAMVLVTEDGSRPLTVVVIAVLVREVLIGVVAIVLGVAGARRIDVVWAGKAGTLAIMCALPLFLWAAHVDGGLHAAVALVGWSFAIVGLAMGWYAVARYIPAARAALAEGRTARAHLRRGGRAA